MGPARLLKSGRIDIVFYLRTSWNSPEPGRTMSLPAPPLSLSSLMQAPRGRLFLNEVTYQRCIPPRLEPTTPSSSCTRHTAYLINTSHLHLQGHTALHRGGGTPSRHSGRPTSCTGTHHRARTHAMLMSLTHDLRTRTVPPLTRLLHKRATMSRCHKLAAP